MMRPVGADSQDTAADPPRLTSRPLVARALRPGPGEAARSLRDMEDGDVEETGTAGPAGFEPRRWQSGALAQSALIWFSAYPCKVLARR